MIVRPLAASHDQLIGVAEGGGQRGVGADQAIQVLAEVVGAEVEHERARRGRSARGRRPGAARRVTGCRLSEMAFSTTKTRSMRDADGPHEILARALADGDDGGARRQRPRHQPEVDPLAGQHLVLRAARAG